MNDASHQAPRTDDTPKSDHQLTTRLRCRIDDSPLHAWSRQIDVTCQHGTAMFRGKLPSFYLKQLLQTIVRDVPGVKRIENHVSVPDR